MIIETFFNYMLQNKTEVIKQALSNKLPSPIIRSLFVISLLCFGVFGFLIGCSHSIGQGAVSFVKLPFLFYITGAICFPTLYIFLSLLGVSISLKGLTHFSIIVISIMSIILIAFSPVSLFFLILGVDYQMYKILNVIMMAVAGGSGVYIFRKYVLSNVPEELNDKNRSKAVTFIRVWLIMFGLIGANLGFAMSPVFGDPSIPFLLFTPSNENFFSHILSMLR